VSPLAIAGALELLQVQLRSSRCTQAHAGALELARVQSSLPQTQSGPSFDPTQHPLWHTQNHPSAEQRTALLLVLNSLREATKGTIPNQFSLRCDLGVHSSMSWVATHVGASTWP